MDMLAGSILIVLIPIRSCQKAPWILAGAKIQREPEGKDTAFIVIIVPLSWIGWWVPLSQLITPFL